MNRYKKTYLPIVLFKSCLPPAKASKANEIVCDAATFPFVIKSAIEIAAIEPNAIYTETFGSSAMTTPHQRTI